MKTQISFRAMALAGVCLAPFAATAQTADDAAHDYNNAVELGARWQSRTSPVFGRYNGASEKGFTSLGGFNLEGRGANDLGPTFYYQAFGRDLDVNQKEVAPDGSLGVKLGNQGTWGVGASYDSISYTGQTFSSPYYPSGALAPGFRAFGGAGTGTTAASKGTYDTNYYNSHQSALASALLRETAGTRREIVDANGKYRLGDWTFSTDFKNEHKEGTVVQTMRYGTVGSQYAFPEPVNYDTQRYQVKGAFTAERLQAVVAYDYSKFTDNNSVFLAQGYASPLTATAAAPFQVTSAYSLPPSNDAHQISGSVGYDLTGSTRLDGAFHYGLQMQNDDVQQGSGTPVYQSVLNNQTSNLMARIYGGEVSINASPLPKLDLRAAYNIDARDDESNPSAVYGSAGGDGAATRTLTMSGFSWTNQTASLEAGYRILPRTKVTLGYTFKDVHRAYQNALGAGADWYSHSGENTLLAKLTSSPVAGVNTSVSYEHAVRAANVAAYAANDQGLWYQAPMVADTVKLRGSYDPLDSVSLGMNGKLALHHYNYPVNTYGVERDHNGSIGPDLSYRPSKTVSTHLFYTYEEIYYSNQIKTGNTSNGNFGTNASTTDVVHTTGLSADWKPIDRLKLGADYVFSYGNINYDVFDGIVASGVGTSTTQNLTNPSSVNSSMHSVKLKGEYELTPAISLLGGYQFDLLTDKDWAYSYAAVLPSGTSYQLTSGETNPSYHVHTLYTAVRVKF